MVKTTTTSVTFLLRTDNVFWTSDAFLLSFLLAGGRAEEKET